MQFNKNKLLGKRILFVVAGVILSLLFFFSPLFDFLFRLPCFFHVLTHFNCPGCGSQRALLALFKGNVLQAFAYNALFMISLLIAVCYLCGIILNRLSIMQTHPTKIYTKKMGWVMVTIVLLFWIFRNIPQHPFSLLAPHEL